MNKRRSFLTGLAGLVGLSSAKEASADEKGGELPLLFAYRTTVVKFSGAPPTVAGDDVGTTEGVLNGALIQTFKLQFTSPTTVLTGPDFGLFTDLDGDQINFLYSGTGNFLPPGGLLLAGGPLRVTYTVTNATGKYRFLIGRQFPAKVIATNSVNGLPGGLGSVYGEVYSADAKSIAKTLGRT
jgi:hypothetical protein